ncbi:MAG: ABC transporter permease [Clostridiales bacterium]|nr:ABC transporter permease [Clostridiales bacterium]
MLKYILKRLGISIIVLFGVSIILYTMVRLMPNNYIETKYASQLQQGTMTWDDINYFKDLYGLNGSIIEGYTKWLSNLFTKGLGNSFKYEMPVTKVIGDNMWISFAIAVVATILQFLISIPLGISSATHQYTARDYAVTIFTMMGISLPTYFFAAIVIKVFSVELGWLPANGLIYATANYPDTFIGGLQKFGDIVKHLILPVGVSVILSLGGLMRYTRTNMLEVLSADYIRTARAKGLSEKTVIYKHAFRNTMIPLATLLAGILPSLFGGMMITEQVFGIDGIGRLAYNALKEGDIPFVMGYNMFLAILTVIGTLFSDIMYSIVDPRVKLGK